MAVSIILGFLAIRQRQGVSAPSMDETYAYADESGAGTQAVTQIPLVMILGKLDSLLTLAIA